MIITDKIQEKIDYYEQAYFYTDDPVPFLGDLKVYPVLSKNYYKFYSNLSCLTMDKTTKKVIEKDQLGKEVVKFVPNIEGISLSNMGYLISQMEEPTYGRYITAQFVNILELCLREQNGFFCPNCGKRLTEEAIRTKLKEWEDKVADMSESEKNAAQIDFFTQLSNCECGSQFREVYSIKNNNGVKNICILNHELTNDDLEELAAIIIHQNILDYDEDQYMDPNLRADMEAKKKLENKSYSSPSLEKQLVCVSVSSPYSIEELKETVTLRKLSFMLKIIDSKNSYYAQIQGAMSGMVKFKEDPKHWIFSGNNKDTSKDIMSMNDIQSKFAAVT